MTIAWAPLTWDEFTALQPGDLVWVEVDTEEYVAAEIVARTEPDTLQARVLNGRADAPLFTATRKELARKHVGS